MRKILNPALLVTFVLTVMVPVTGVPLHKLISVVFLILCLIHTVIHRQRLGSKRFFLLGIILASFALGLFGMIFRTIPLVMVLHRAVSLGVVFFMAIHIFVFRKRFG